MKGKIMNEPEKLELPELNPERLDSMTAPPPEEKLDVIGTPAPAEAAPPDTETSYQMGTIKAIQYGKTENGVGLAYIIQILQGQVAMFMPANQVTELLDKTNINNINMLVNMSCVMQVKDNNLSFVQLLQ